MSLKKIIEGKSSKEYSIISVHMLWIKNGRLSN